MNIRPAHAIDFYKSGHVFQYPDLTEYVSSNWTARSTKRAKMLSDYDNKTVFFGLQGYVKYFLIDRWNGGFFNLPKEKAVRKYKRRVDNSLGKDVVSVAHLEALHDLGYLPLRIKALPEGSRVNIRVPSFTIVNTNPDFFWLTNYIETSTSADLWKPSTVATIAFEYKRLLTKYARKTGAPMEFVPIQGHDFSYRGMSGSEDAARSGSGHLLSFYGTDTVVAIDYAEDYYNAMEIGTGGSVSATEHSVMSMGLEGGEKKTIKRLIKDIYPSGIISIVSDTWNFWNVIKNIASDLKDDILARTPNELGLAKVVFRPDSGDPFKIICGDADAPVGSDEYKGAAEILWEVFGGTKTDEGYRMINERVGLIYGDSITLERAEAILDGLAKKGFASNNIVFGIGSFTYQFITRDTFGYAMKSTWGVVNGEARSLSKDPVTDSGEKKSAVGLLRVEREGNDFVLYENQTLAQEKKGALELVFEDGVLYRDEDFETVRSTLNAGMYFSE